MSKFFKKLFGASEVESSQTANPWTTAPDWLKKQLSDESGIRMDILDQASAEAERLGADPLEILRQNGIETDSLTGVMDSMVQSGALGGQAADAAGFDLGSMIDSYKNPYMEDVVDTTLAGMDRNQQRSLMDLDSRAAQVGGTSNTRAAVARAVSEGNYGLDRAGTEAGLRSGAFDKAVGFGQDEAGLEMQRAGVYDDLATSNLNRGITGNTWTKSFGGEGRQLQQAQLGANRGAKSESLSWLSDIFSGATGTQAPFGNSSVKTEEGPSPFSQILGTIAAVGGTALKLSTSDVNAKADISPIGDGAMAALNLVIPSVYEYRDGVVDVRPGRTAGLIAQDLGHIPGAVVDDGGLHLKVDPYPVLATIVKATQELDARLGGLEAANG